MESSSKIYGDRTEECQSSESGWTMYIGSSMDDDDDNDDDDDDNGDGKKGVVKDDEDEDTDDSMTSDASSGPNHLHLQQPWEVQQDESHKKLHDQQNYRKKNKKSVRKKKVGCEESRKKDESLVNEKRGVIKTVQSGNRAWFLGKRK
ncbi:hypothetical protein R6Q59_029058 [Mikania micrantha]